MFNLFSTTYAQAGTLLNYIRLSIKSFRDLDAWKLSMDLAESVYTVTKRLPSDERFNLVSQLRRSAVGIPSNISEGHQQSIAVYRRYVMIALGCLAECETQLELARRLNLAPQSELRAVIEKTTPVRRVLHGLLRSLNRNR